MKSKTTYRLALCLCCAALASCTNMFPQAQKEAPGNLDHPPGGSRFLPPEDNTTVPPPETPGNSGDNTTTLPPQVNPPDNTTPPVVTPNPPVPSTPAPAPASQTPYGKPVPGKKGFVYSPFDEKAGMIDVRDYAPGTKVRDPYTNKIFLVP